MRKVRFEQRHITLREHVDRSIPPPGLHEASDMSGWSEQEHWRDELRSIVAQLDGVKLISHRSGMIRKPNKDPDRIGILQGEEYGHLVEIRLEDSDEVFKLQTSVERFGPPALLKAINQPVLITVATYPDSS